MVLNDSVPTKSDVAATLSQSTSGAPENASPTNASVSAILAHADTDKLMDSPPHCKPVAADLALQSHKISDEDLTELAAGDNQGYAAHGSHAKAEAPRSPGREHAGTHEGMVRASAAVGM